MVSSGFYQMAPFFVLRISDRICNMSCIVSLFVFIFGLCIGSFLNVVIYRLEPSFAKGYGRAKKDESFVKGRSCCPHCKHQLKWLDLIPVVSFLFLQGKCRYCHAKISWQYPLVEIATGLVFLLIFNDQFSTVAAAFGTTNMTAVRFVVPIFNLAFLFYVAGSLIVIFVYDLKWYLIPDKVLFPAIIIAFLYHLFESVFTGNWVLGTGNFLLAALIASGFFLFIFLVSKGRWMGFGDVKLAILLGLLLGFPNILLGLFLSFFFGAIIGTILLFFKKKGLKSEMPFAPFLIIGTFAALFFGKHIIQWYLSLFI